jgi:hypothetical protein
VRRQPFRGSAPTCPGRTGKMTASGEVVDGVIETSIGYLNAYAVIVEDGVVLVDTGLPTRVDRVASAIEDAPHRIG